LPTFLCNVGSAIILYGSIAFAQQSQNATSKALEFSNANITSSLKPGNTTYNTVLLDAKMLQLTASNKPQDIATLAFILGYPLVPVAGDYAYYTTRACYCSVTTNGITNGSTINLLAAETRVQQSQSQVQVPGENLTYLGRYTEAIKYYDKALA